MRLRTKSQKKSRGSRERRRATTSSRAHEDRQWWTNFQEMLTPEQLDKLGVSQDRGSALCITRLAGGFDKLWRHTLEQRRVLDLALDFVLQGEVEKLLAPGRTELQVELEKALGLFEEEEPPVRPADYCLDHGDPIPCGSCGQEAPDASTPEEVEAGAAEDPAPEKEL